MLNKKSSRVLINLIGVPLLLAIIILGDDTLQFPIFSFFVLIVLLLGAREIPVLIDKMGGNLFLPLLMFFIMILQINRLFHSCLYLKNYDLIVFITLFAMIIEIFRKKKTPIINIFSLVFSFIWLGVMLGSLSVLRNLEIIGFPITLCLFLSIWICDTSAFLFGKKFGKKKILPNVSPNKTWIGTLMGLIFSLIFMNLIYSYELLPFSISLLDTLCIGLIVGVFGQLGDFSQSLLKREAKIKDSSDILRGHGGILDRFDSLIFSAPLTLIYCNYFI
jgi:phosphatidate cytidylyltransferase